MGNNCAAEKKKKPSGPGGPDVFEVNDQDLLMDSNEIKVLRVRHEDPKKKGNEPFNGYVQRNAFVVLPKIDKFRQEKLMLKR